MSRWPHHAPEPTLERWTITGENQEGVRHDATYHGPDGYRVVRGITLPYTTDARPGETSVQFSVRWAR